jgi:hypothetical protein
MPNTTQEKMELTKASNWTVWITVYMCSKRVKKIRKGVHEETVDISVSSWSCWATKEERMLGDNGNNLKACKI